MPQELKSRGSGRRTFWFLVVLFVLMLGAVGVSSHYFIREAAVLMKRDLEHNLKAAAQNKTALITVWLGGLKNSVLYFAETDMFRLFTAEAHRVHAMQGGGHKVQKAPLEDTAGEHAQREHKQLRDSLPLMNTQLRNFSRSLGLLGARVVESDMEILLTTDSTLPQLTPIQMDTVHKAQTTGTLHTSLVESSAEGLVMDVAQPIFPPAYLDLPPDKAIATLLLHVPVTAPLSSFFDSGKDGSPMRILQYPAADGPLQELVPATGSVRSLEGWHAAPDTPLPLQRRSLPDGSQVYSLAVETPELPWLVAWEEKTDRAEAAYISTRNTVLLGAGAALTTASLLLCFVWWLMVGRSERAFSQELRRLYEEVNNQKQLLDGINMALADGVVMTDNQGRIKFSNASFAVMVGHAANTIVGLDASALFTPDTARRLVALRSHVLESSKGRIYNDVFLMHGRKRHFQIACSPYRSENGEVTGTVSVYRDTTLMMEAQEHSQRMVRQTINVLMRAIEAVDPYLCGHSAQAGYLAAALAQRLGLSNADRDTVRTAATLSQIGMLRLPPNLLRKSGALSAEERALMEKHVAYACQLLAGFDFGLPVQDTIGQMHECLDGSGYPGGLKGEQIGLHARILAVANVFCAMIRPRSYRQAKDVQEVLIILAALPPKYDPGIVDMLQEFLHTEKGQAFLRELQGTGQHKKEGAV